MSKCLSDIVNIWWFSTTSESPILIQIKRSCELVQCGSVDADLAVLYLRLPKGDLIRVSFLDVQNHPLWAVILQAWVKQTTRLVQWTWKYEYFITYKTWGKHSGVYLEVDPLITQPSTSRCNSRENTFLRGCLQKGEILKFKFYYKFFKNLKILSQFQDSFKYKQNHRRNKNLASINTELIYTLTLHFPLWQSSFNSHVSGLFTNKL